MKWHCGLLSDEPEKDRTLQWIKRGCWDTLPDDVQHELRIWMAMPGFAVSYHHRAFGLNREYISRQMGGYERYKGEVHENWLSATREDCLKLCLRRRGGNVPVISQLQMLNDLKAGQSALSVAREYRVSKHTIYQISKGTIRCHGELPLGFALLGATRVQRS